MDVRELGEVESGATRSVRNRQMERGRARRSFPDGALNHYVMWTDPILKAVADLFPALSNLFSGMIVSCAYFRTWG